MDIKELRNCFGKFATGVVVAATGTRFDDLCGLTINSFSSVSLSPPLVLFSIANESSNLEKFQNNQFFTLNILSEQQSDLAIEFAKANNPLKWDIEQYRLTSNSCPIFENALSYLECKSVNIFKSGDHHVIIGEVVDFKNLDEEKKPLLYFKSKFGTIQNG